MFLALNSQYVPSCPLLCFYTGKEKQAQIEWSTEHIKFRKISVKLSPHPVHMTYFEQWRSNHL